MRREKYLTATPYGTRASIRIGGKLYQKHFPSGADVVDMRQWIVDTELAHRKGPIVSGSFQSDAVRYLQAVASMPTYADRKRDIDAWIIVFGDRVRSTIGPPEIAAALHNWRKTLAASTCNHRRTALMHLYTVLDGKGAKNPVKDVPRFPEPSPAPRGLTYADIRKILKHVPKGRELAHLTVIAFIGLPHSMIPRIAERDWRTAAKTGELAVPGRRKGAGSRGMLLPLTPGGKRAAQMIVKTGAFAAIPRWRLRRLYREACEAAGVARESRPYDLRHSFATELYRKSGDEAAVQMLVLHSSPAMTKRYTLAAVPERLRRAIKGFGR